ncbi:CDP-alcohol phosphatidyltransferase family protein [Actinomyces timonensis]|uniref:CDP-alcohol phosphatidyltransferase family protein n=1 Tax=Actinomyces timonensis TaxID=1288391 RepID=A0AAU8MZP4_9ACTO
MPSLYGLKHWYTRRLTFLINASVRHGISPDTWTLVGVIAGALGAGAIALGWWPLAFLLLAARLGGANLDGAVARARGVSRPFGFVLNEIGDRASDLLMMAGLVGLGVRIGAPRATIVALLIAALAATLPTFISLSAAGAGAPRLNGGPLGKTERCLIAVVASAVPSWLAPVAWLLIAGSILTAGARLARAHRLLPSPGPLPEGVSPLGAGPAE